MHLSLFLSLCSLTEFISFLCSFDRQDRSEFAESHRQPLKGRMLTLHVDTRPFSLFFHRLNVDLFAYLNPSHLCYFSYFSPSKDVPIRYLGKLFIFPTVMMMISHCSVFCSVRRLIGLSNAHLHPSQMSRRREMFHATGMHLLRLQNYPNNYILGAMLRATVLSRAYMRENSWKRRSYLPGTRMPHWRKMFHATGMY